MTTMTTTMPTTMTNTMMPLTLHLLERTVAAPAQTTFSAVQGGPRALLRLEGAVVLGAAILAYRHLHGSGGLFAALFLVPDLSMLGYLIGRRCGAIAYNAAHSYLTTAVLALLATLAGHPLLALCACIHAAHVGFDRMAGYGLKYASAFGDTHLGRVGQKSAGRQGA